MTIAITQTSDITSFIQSMYEPAYFAVKAQNLLVGTVRIFSDTIGMESRKSTEYGALNPRSAAEGEDVTPTRFDRSALATLTPGRVADQVVLTDQRITTDSENVRADIALEMGAATGGKVDTDIASDFSSLTGGTVGTTGGTITLTSVARARAMQQVNKIPGPYFCVLHPYQWLRLYESATANGAAFSMAPGFQDRLVQNYFVTSLLGDVIFVVTPNLAVSGSAATGALYNSLALAYDERKPFNIRPQRDESKEAWELNYSIWYGHGVWRAGWGVQLLGLATMPS